MEAHKVLNLLQLLILLTQFLEERPAVDLLLQLVNIVLVVVNNARLV